MYYLISCFPFTEITRPLFTVINRSVKWGHPFLKQGESTEILTIHYDASCRVFIDILQWGGLYFSISSLLKIININGCYIFSLNLYNHFFSYLYCRYNELINFQVCIILEYLEWMSLSHDIQLFIHYGLSI